MIRINQLKLPVGHTEKQLEEKIKKQLRIPKDGTITYEIVKRSIDARKAPVCYVYTVETKSKAEEKLVKKLGDRNITVVNKVVYEFPKPGNTEMKERPVIIGSGPAGLFCTLMLARAGFQPVLLERGEAVEKRQKTVESFWKSGILKPDSNVQFGEGGAGTFSDGKLNTLVKDTKGRNREVLNIFAKAGANPEILYENKPHIGTDILVTVVKNIRKEILSLGGEIYFGHQVVDFLIEKNEIVGLNVVVKDEEKTYQINTKHVVCAIGHSARDTFEVLEKRNIPMRPKAFAVGVRIEHLQSMVNQSQYGKDYLEELPAAAYKVTRKVSGDRGVYSFCMCPGGYVVNASSEEGHLAVNGMSYEARDGENANSAMIVTVTPEDFESDHVLAGIDFQRKLEKKAYEIAKGAVPVQLLGDFLENQTSTKLGQITPNIKGRWEFANVRSIFPKELSKALAEGITGCDSMIRGFKNPDSVISGVESRTSSPVKIIRDENFESEIKGFYPCGEGAGYAGGIMSAAMDGMKVAEEITKYYHPKLECTSK